MKTLIYEEYGLKVQKLFRDGPYHSFNLHQTKYLIVPANDLDEEEVYELYQLAEYMSKKREPYIASIVLTKKNNLYFHKEKARYILVKCSPYTQGRLNQPGRELAKFHQKGRAFPLPLKKTLRIGQWKYLWEKRLDQLEMFWQERVYSQPLNQFEKLFVESYPYYLGLSENAIQYLVDTELDENPEPIDSGTICHHRFNSQTWNPSQCIKLPTDWVFDHCSRDISEYMRYQFFNKQNLNHPDAFTFLDEYDRTTPLSLFSLRLIYSRLLFPVHYFECIENYYLSNEAEKPSYLTQLMELLDQSSKYERFIKTYSSNVAMKRKSMFIPAVDWLRN